MYKQFVEVEKSVLQTKKGGIRENSISLQIFCAFSFNFCLLSMGKNNTALNSLSKCSREFYCIWTFHTRNFEDAIRHFLSSTKMMGMRFESVLVGSFVSINNEFCGSISHNSNWVQSTFLDSVFCLFIIWNAKRVFWWNEYTKISLFDSLAAHINMKWKATKRGG